MAPGLPLMALGGPAAQGQSGWYADGLNRRFFLVLDSRGCWRQVISHWQRLGAAPFHRLSAAIPLLAFAGQQSDAEDGHQQQQTTNNPDTAVVLPAQDDETLENALVAGYHVQFDDARGVWKEEPEFWAEDLTTKVCSTPRFAACVLQAAAG